MIPSWGRFTSTQALQWHHMVPRDPPRVLSPNPGKLSAHGFEDETVKPNWSHISVTLPPWSRHMSPLVHDRPITMSSRHHLTWSTSILTLSTWSTPCPHVHLLVDVTKCQQHMVSALALNPLVQAFVFVLHRSQFIDTNSLDLLHCCRWWKWHHHWIVHRVVVDEFYHHRFWTSYDNLGDNCPH